MDVLQQIWQWMLEAAAWEWVFSGVGLPVAGWFLLRCRRKPPAPKDTPPGGKTVTNTFTQSGTGDHNVFSQTGNVRYEEHHHYPRTPQGIPLQRPRQPDHLVGREKLLEKVLATLQPGKALTLCGPGGMGKTALAARVAWELAPQQEAPTRFPDGLLFYSFYGRKEMGLACEHLVRSYSDDAPDIGPEAVSRLLANKQALIMLDGAEEADDLPALLRCCGGCGVLITSRKRSDAPSKLFQVKPLDKLPAAEAFRLYSGIDEDKDTVWAVCAKLGGWPLALRLAGQYLRNTGESARDYLRWLKQEPFKELGSGKHQEENAALLLRRSMDQVSEDARCALSMAGCLAFAPIAREPVAAVLEDDERRARKALGELVNYGLLERYEQRWQINHALIHTYACNHLPLSRETLERVAAYYIVWCREQSAAGVPGYARMDDERGHCLRLIGACLDRELWEEVQGLVAAITTYLDRQGHWVEFITALEMRLTAAQQAEDRRDKAWCLNSLGYTCERRKELEQALAWYEQCLPLCRELDDKQGEGKTLNNMAAIYRQQGKYEQALETYQQSLSIRQEVGDREGEGTTLNNIAGVYYAQEDYEQALEYYEQCLPIRREVGDTIGEGTTLNNIAVIYDAQGKLDKAAEYHEQALAIRREQGDRAGEAQSCWNIGRTYENMGDLAKAEEYIALAVEIEEAINSPNLEDSRKGLERLRAKRRE